MILACDGVWDILSNQEAVDFVHEGISNGLSDKEIVESVFKRCISEDPKMTSGLGGDNMTFLLVRFLDMQSSQTANQCMQYTLNKNVNKDQEVCAY